MGQLFELIADSALEKLDSYYSECHVCGRTQIDLYPYTGILYSPDGHTDDDIYAVCSDCMSAQPLTHMADTTYIQTIEKYLDAEKIPADQVEKVKKALIDKYQRTPDIPVFMQYDDRPLCCCDITEFAGYPAGDDELYKISESIYWEKGVKEKSELYDFRKYGGPESLRDVAGFTCSHCNKHYFTFQFT